MSDKLKTMKFVILTVVLFVALAANVYGLPQPQKYTTRYDNISVDDVLKSGRLVDNYCKCILDLGKCTPDGQELKNNIIDALQTDCSKCSEKQKKETPRVLKHLKEHRREDCFNPMIAKYDPNNEYKDKFEAEIAAVTE